MFDIYDVIIEVYLGDRPVQRQRMQAPKEMLMLHFMQLVEQIQIDKRPMMIKMSRQEIIYDRFENKQKVIDSYIEFRNNAMG